MAKQSWAVALVGLCFGCGASSGNAPPAQQPDDEAKLTPASEPAATEETAAVADDTETASTPSEPTADDEKDESPKRACDVLDKATCKVTVGCAWNDVRKCVKE